MKNNKSENDQMDISMTDSQIMNLLEETNEIINPNENCDSKINFNNNNNNDFRNNFSVSVQRISHNLNNDFPPIQNKMNNQINTSNNNPFLMQNRNANLRNHYVNNSLRGELFNKSIANNNRNFSGSVNINSSNGIRNYYQANNIIEHQINQLSLRNINPNPGINYNNIRPLNNNSNYIQNNKNFNNNNNNNQTSKSSKIAENQLSKSEEIKISAEDIEMIEMLIKEEQKENEILNKQSDNSHNNSYYNINQINEDYSNSNNNNNNINNNNNNLMDIEDLHLPRIINPNPINNLSNNVNVYNNNVNYNHPNNNNINNNINNQNQKKKNELENERNLFIKLESELMHMSLEEFDLRFNIANSLAGQMQPEINSYYLVVRVFDDSYERRKTVFCISCLENSFYFNLINKRNPKDERNNGIDIDYNSFKSILSFYPCYRIELQDIWSQVILEEKDKIFLNSTIYQIQEKKYIINLKGTKNKLENYIVIEPEFMLTPTEIRPALNCIRKEHFSHDHYYPSSDKDNRSSMIIGTLVHKILEEILCDFQKFSEFKKIYSFTQSEKNKENFEPDSFTNSSKLKNRIKSKFLDVLPEFANKIQVLLQKTEQEIYREVEPFFETIQQFILNYVVHKQKILSRTIEEIVAIEKSFNSQVLGLKGNVDVLCETKISSANLIKPTALRNFNDFSVVGAKAPLRQNEEIKVVVPIELKTGSRSAQNVPDKFQVVMYFLMIMEHMRNVENVDESPFAYGLLVYLKMQDNAGNPKKRNLKVDTKIKEKYVDITQQLYAEDEKGSDNTVCKNCYVKDICYKIHLNIENPQLKAAVKNILQERQEHKEIKQTMKLLIEYEANSNNRNNNFNNNINNVRNANQQIKQNLISFPQEAIEEIEEDDFDYESAKLKHPFLIRQDFINESLLIDPDYIEYFKFQQKLIKNTEVHKFLIEDSLLNTKKALDFKKFQIESIKENKHSYSLFILIPEENFKDLFLQKLLKKNEKNNINNNIENNDENNDSENNNYLSSGEIPATEKTINNAIATRLLGRTITVFDEAPEYDCLYPGIIENFIFYNAQAQNLLLEISVLKHYMHLTRIKNTENPLLNVWLKNKVANFTGLAKNYKGNIYELLLNPKFEQLRRTIIKNEKPLFSEEENLMQEISVVLSEEAIRNELTLLNDKQKEALMKILLARNYCTIEGFPGTGKTFLLVLAIKILRRLGKKVLISSFTNCALDSILLRLKEKGIKFHRFGYDYKMHEELKHDKECFINQDSFSTIAEWNKFYKEIGIIGCTSIGANTQMLLGIRFDYCFVDEAGQLAEYNILGPIMLAERFVLIGDTHQLPPLHVIPVPYNPESLFKRLINSHPEANVKLNIQYRMNQEIQSLSNSMVYSEALECANDLIKFRKLKIDLFKIQNKLSKISLKLFKEHNHNFISIMLRAWNPALPVVFLNYNSKNYDAKKYKFENNTNPFEADLVYYLTKAIFAANYDPKEIGILTPFLNQEFYLRKRLEKYNIKDNIITIDKSQGSEKDVIIISFCSNDTEGKLLSSIERLNVAFTRAKKKIICVGNFESLKRLNVLKDYLSLIEINKWILNYPVIVEVERNEN